MDTYKRSIRGLQSRSNGEHFEGMILAASRFYEERGIAAVDKTPEAFKVLKAMDRNRGQFICCFTKQAQPDFKGILMDSTMILFDAKHTDKDKISRDVVTTEQQACFERYMKLGAMCFLVVSLEFKEFYRVPWVVFRDMKKIYGHKYMNREELEPYRIKYSNGVVKALGMSALTTEVVFSEFATTTIPLALRCVCRQGIITKKRSRTLLRSARC